MANDISRRNFLKLLSLGSLSAPFASSLFAQSQQPSGNLYSCYIGTYTGGDSKGIYRASFDSKAGSLEIKQATSGIENPSFLALSPNRQFLYAVSETGQYQGDAGGSVQAFRVDTKTGDLEKINEQPTRGAHPCHLAVDKTGQNVLVANYTGGNVTVLPVDENGGLKTPSTVVQHEGSGPNKDRQEAPHAHFIAPDPANRFALAVDLGTDQVISYPLDPAKGVLDSENAIKTALEPGAGPRHLAFHPNGKWMFVINELNSTMSVLDYDAETGNLSHKQTTSTLPEGFNEHNQTAEVQVSADGRFVYGSNRGHNSIVVHKVDPERGKLSTVQHQSTLGDWPRFFGMDPSGKFLLVANRRTNNIVVFNRDIDSGMIEPAGKKLDVPAPVCIVFR